MTTRRKIFVPIALTAVFFLCTAEDGCDDKSDTREHSDVERQQDWYTRNQPVPFYEYSLERNLMIQLYNARNKQVTTYTYEQSPYTGKILDSCVSLGYPIPGGTQLTNPQKRVYTQTTLPQAEPNGLYTPATSNGTWIMCLSPDGSGKVEPRYMEPSVKAYPRPMKEVNGQMVPLEGGVASFTLDPNKPAEVTKPPAQ